jgi:hypothetical protein
MQLDAVDEANALPVVRSQGQISLVVREIAAVLPELMPMRLSS